MSHLRLALFAAIAALALVLSGCVEPEDETNESPDTTQQPSGDVQAPLCQKKADGTCRDDVAPSPGDEIVGDDTDGETDEDVLQPNGCEAVEWTEITIGHDIALCHAENGMGSEGECEFAMYEQDGQCVTDCMPNFSGRPTNEMEAVPGGFAYNHPFLGRVICIMQ